MAGFQLIKINKIPFMQCVRPIIAKPNKMFKYNPIPLIANTLSMVKKNWTEIITTGVISPIYELN